MDNTTKEDPESSPAALHKLPQANNLLKKGLVFIVAAYAVMILYHFIVSKGLAVQPLARCGLAVVLGFFAFKGQRWSTWILVALAIAWILESLIGATRENLEWHARVIPVVRGILTGFGLYYLWNTIRLQKPVELTNLPKANDLLKKGLVIIVSAYALMLLYHYIVSKELAIQPLARVCGVLLFGFLSFTGRREAVGALILLAIAGIAKGGLEAKAGNLTNAEIGALGTYGVILASAIFYLFRSIKTPDLMIKGIGLFLLSHSVVIVYQLAVVKQLEVYPVAGLVLGAVLGVVAFAGQRSAIIVLILLSIIWIYQSASVLIKTDVQTMIIIRGILLCFGLSYLIRAYKRNFEEWYDNLLASVDLQKVSMNYDSTTQHALERMSHLFNAGFGKCQIMEIMELAKKLENNEQKTFVYSPLHNLKLIPLKIVIEQDNFSPTINFFSTKEVAQKINVMKAMA